MREFFSLYRLLTRSGEIWWGEAIIVLCLLLLKHALRGLQMEPIAVMGAISAGLALILAYPVETHTHYMLGVYANGRRGRTLDVVGVGDNRTGTP